jgi:hypothetical protein
MIRSILLALFVIFMFIPTIQASEPFESTSCVSGSMNIIHANKELMASSFDIKGMLRSDSNSEIFNDVSEWCVGLFSRVGDEITQRGFCKYIYLNGDINIIEWDGKANGGNFKFLMGTGKWKGIEGGGTWSIIQRAKSVAPGTLQNCRKLKGTYELPK